MEKYSNGQFFLGKVKVKQVMFYTRFFYLSFPSFHKLFSCINLPNYNLPNNNLPNNNLPNKNLPINNLPNNNLPNNNLPNNNLPRIWRMCGNNWSRSLVYWRQRYGPTNIGSVESLETIDITCLFFKPGFWHSHAVNLRTKTNVLFFEETCFFGIIHCTLSKYIAYTALFGKVYWTIFQSKRRRLVFKTGVITDTYDTYNNYPKMFLSI